MRIPRYTVLVLVLILIVLSGWKNGHFSCSGLHEPEPWQNNDQAGINVAAGSLTTWFFLISK